MRMLNETNDLNSLEEVYREAFNDTYHRYPLDLSNFGRTNLKDTYNRLKDFDLLKDLITHYLTMKGLGKDNTWFKQNGHPIKLLKENLDAVYTSWCEIHAERQQYVVGFSESGEPIYDFKAVSVVKGMPAIPVEKWKSLDEEKRFIFPEERWKNAGADTAKWVLTWAERERKQIVAQRDSSEIKALIKKVVDRGK